jgi:hypothetical protein
MPLNRLHVRHIDYPNTKDAIAMVSKLEYAEKYDTALRYFLFNIYASKVSVQVFKPQCFVLAVIFMRIQLLRRIWIKTRNLPNLLKIKSSIAIALQNLISKITLEKIVVIKDFIGVHIAMSANASISIVCGHLLRIKGMG